MCCVALRCVLRGFADPELGCLGSRKRVPTSRGLPDRDIAGEKKNINPPDAIFIFI